MSTLDDIMEMARLSSQMVEAASAHDWEALLATEKGLARLRDAVIAKEPGGRQIDPLSAPERQRKAALLQQIRSDCDRVRQEVEPFQASVRRWLAVGATGRSLRQAYQAGAR
ncbi:MAG: flagellar protein FliT [Zoogloeaceae bacterium]|nr:flagellar protein FliT [Zoogloeaceae bacterium]